MQSDIHLRLHAQRAAELQGEALAAHAAAAFRQRREHRDALRHRFGWVLVEVGLRLVQPRRQPAPQP